MTIRPVIWMDADDAVDGHDPPEPMREQVILRDPTCRFPHCQVDSRRCDLDHIVPYDPTGPPGQTRPSNLAPLCRRHHNAKTSGLWRYTRTPEGDYHWTGRRRPPEPWVNHPPCGTHVVADPVGSCARLATHRQTDAKAGGVARLNTRSARGSVTSRPDGRMTHMRIFHIATAADWEDAQGPAPTRRPRAGGRWSRRVSSTPAEQSRSRGCGRRTTPTSTSRWCC